MTIAGVQTLPGCVATDFNLKYQQLSNDKTNTFATPIGDCFDFYYSYNSYVMQGAYISPGCVSQMHYHCQESFCGNAENCDLLSSVESIKTQGQAQNCYNNLSRVCSGEPISQGGTIEELEPIVQKCEHEAQETEQSCTTMGDGIQGALQSVLSSASKTVTSGASGLDACSDVAQSASAVQAALTGVQGNCSVYYSACQSSCQSASAAVTDAKKRYSATQPEAISSYEQRAKSAKSQCAKGAAYLKDLNSNIQQVASQYQKSAACAEQQSASGISFEACLKDPSVKGCEVYGIQTYQDCSNPTYAASNLTCVCLANPADSRCKSSSSLSKLGNPSLGNASSHSDPTGSNFLNDDSFGGPSYEPPQIEGQNNPQQGKGSLAAGAGGGALGGGGSDLNTPPEKWKPGAGKSGYSTDILKSSKGGLMGPGMGSKYGNGQLQVPAAGISTGPFGRLKNKLNQVDLRQFLPGGSFDPRRQVAGVTGPDGITGPFSDNFKKINLRYLNVKTTLMP